MNVPGGSICMSNFLIWILALGVVPEPSQPLFPDQIKCRKFSGFPGLLPCLDPDS
jgi:hypothetical protein